MNEIDSKRIIGAYMNIEKKEVKHMKRINAKEDRVMTDSEMAGGLSSLDIPYLDMGEGPKTVRHTGPNGEIIDEVVRSGEKGDNSWTIEVSRQEALQKEYDRENAKFRKHMAEIPSLTLD